MPLYRGQRRLILVRKPVVVASSYQGLGDVVTGATAFASTARAYNAAFTAGSTAIMDLFDQAGAHPTSINVLPTGFVDLAAIAAWVTANSVSTIKVTKLYDQTGNGNHFSQATLALMPDLSLLAVNGLPALSFPLSGCFLATSTTFTQAEPIGLSAVFNRVTGAGGYISASNVTVDLRGAGTANNMGIAFGTTIAMSVTDNAWHAVNTTGSASVGQGATNIDGVDTTGQTTGTTGLSGSALQIGKSSAGAFLIGAKIAEVAFYPILLDATKRGLANTNQHSAANGYNF